MPRLVTCTHPSVYEKALTRGKRCEVVGEDPVRRQLKICGDSGRQRWYPMSCFDIEGRPVTVLRSWKFDAPVESDVDDCVEVTCELTDGTRRWALLVTPRSMERILDRNPDDPGFHAVNLIVVRRITHEEVDRVLRQMDRHGELEEGTCALPI